MAGRPLSTSIACIQTANDNQEVMGVFRFLAGGCPGTSSRCNKFFGVERAEEESQGRKFFFFHLASWCCGSGLLVGSSINISIKSRDVSGVGTAIARSEH